MDLGGRAKQDAKAEGGGTTPRMGDDSMEGEGTITWK